MKITPAEQRYIESVVDTDRPEVKFALVNRHVLEAMDYIHHQVEGRPPHIERRSVVLWGGKEQLGVLMSLALENEFEVRAAPAGPNGSRADLVLLSPHSRMPLFVELKEADRPADSERYREA